MRTESEKAQAAADLVRSHERTKRDLSAELVLAHLLGKIAGLAIQKSDIQDVLVQLGLTDLSSLGT
jgi:hypothetical protein